MRNFVLVTATYAAGVSATGGGIRKLKRGMTLEDFVNAYILEAKIEAYQRYDRAGTITIISKNDQVSCSWNFTLYPENDLLSAVSHLSKEELLRDLKELLPLKAELQ